MPLEVEISFELEKPDRKLLPKDLEGILVKGEPAESAWFTAARLPRLLKKGYLKQLPPKKQKKKK